MKTEDTVEYNSLKWVKKELDLILQEAQTSFSAYIEEPEAESDRLNECIEHLHMVQGTLQMVELFGAAQLAEEMEHVAQALAGGDIDKKDDAYDVLMRAMLQLPDYLESLQAGSKDVPMILLPLLNDLRASRHASLLSENVLFFPNVDISDDAQQFADVEKGRLLPMAKKLRPHYQVGLLGWFKGQKIAASLKRILAVLAELEKNSVDPATRRLWTISAALIEGLASGGIDSSVSIKMLLGHVDRSIKQLIDQGEDVFARSVSSELLKNLLYYIARIDKESQRVNTVKELYRLDELLPGDKELEEARSGLGGLNTELLKTVSQGIREELLEVKDILELFVHSDVQDIGRLSVLPDLLNKIADTLAMLGLGGPREDVLTQRTKIDNIIAGSMEATEDEIMEVASVLLNVEAQLNNFIANRSIQSSGTETELETDMPEGEYREVVSAVVREALQDFSDARQAILGFLEDSSNTDLLKIVLTRLDQVNGAMFMMPVQHIESEIHALRDYIIKVLLNAGEVPDATMQDRMADVVTGIEYYLESIIEGRPRSLESSEIAARVLDEVSSGYEDVDEVELLAPAEEPAPEKANEPAAVAADAEQPAPVSTVKKPAPVAASPAVDKGYVVLGDDADEEILEIFIEEALEELASLNEQFPRWKNNIADEEALTTIRRSFHTLKGSGRLIGAELIGEFAWGFENMLNRVLDKSRPADQDVFDVLEEALGILPQLIEQLTGNREPVENVYELMARADALGKWSKTDRAKVTEAAVSPSVKPEIETAASEAIHSEGAAVDELEAAEPEKELTELDIEIPETAESVIEEEFEAELPVMDVEDESIDMSSVAAGDEDISLDAFDFEDSSAAESLGDDFDIDLTDDLESLQLAMSPASTDNGLPEIDLTEDSIAESDGLSFETEDLIPEQYEPEAGADIDVDPVLFQIFKDESEGHLKQIRSLLDKHYQGEQALIAGPELSRALHTLFGSARTAEVQSIAEICGEAEKYVRLYQEMDSNIIQDDGVSLIDELSRSVSSMLEIMSDPGKQLHSDTALLSRLQSSIQDLHDQLHAPAQIQASSGIDDLVIEEPVEEVVTEVVAEEDSTAQPAVTETLVSYGDVDDELVDIFLEEAEELLDACENCLQRWSSNNADSESVQDLQRQLHTLKGGARMADLTPIGNLTHALESLIIAVTEGRVSFSKDMDSILHESMDNLSDMLAKVKTREPMSSAERLISLLEALKRGEAVDLKKNETEAEDVAAPEPELEDFGIEFEDETEVTEAPVIDDSELVLSEASIGDEAFEIELEPTAEVEVEIEEPQFDEQADEIELDLNEFIKREDQAAKQRMQKTAEQEVVKAKDEPAKSGAQEQVRVRAELLNELVNNAGEVSVYHARMNQQIAGFSFSLTEMEQTVVRLREQLRKLSIETEAQILSRYEKESDQYDADFDPLEMDRFSTMQQISRSLQETVSDIESIKDILGDSVRDAETLLLQESRVSTELQEGLMRTRMVHFGGLASRLRRIVRQTARELDKDVELEISGETSEVDRTVLDRIIAPLEHMLRNAVSHGIETPEQRLAAGKSESGKITIGVDREGGDVVIKVDDDGRGINVKAVREKAIAQGLMERDSQLTDHEILQFIMNAGFSTAEKVTQISGRGVGMDVVDSEIKQLGGLLEIDTAQGKGSTFKIRLPLTLAINHALMVSAGEEVYAVPLNAIEGVVRLSGPELQMFYDSDDSKYEFAGIKYELRHLGKILTGNQPDYSRSGQLYPVLLAHVGDHYVALHVDDLLGRREIVVKPVGSQIGNVRIISGATILGDGRVVLILEMNSLVLGDSLIHIDESAAAMDQPETIQAPVAETREPIVMVVDDSITIRKVTERMLGRHNMKVITAKDGVDAVAQLQDIKPDVMLLDIEMPRMDGYEVASHVRNEERLKDLPIIMITSRSGAKHKDKAFEIGVNKYLGKPYQEDELMENIHELIG